MLSPKCLIEVQHQQHKSRADHLQKMLNIWFIHPFFFCNVMKKIGAFKVYSLMFNMADLNWPKDQSTSIRYLWLRPVARFMLDVQARLCKERSKFYFQKMLRGVEPHASIQRYVRIFMKCKIKTSSYNTYLK